MIDIRQLPNLNITQKKFVQQFYTEFDWASVGSGLLRNFGNVEPFLYEGVIAGSEFLLYANTKLYVCFDLYFGSNIAANAARGLITLYDEGNVINVYLQQNSIAYEPVAVAMWYAKNNIKLKNLYFSRILQAGYDYMKFIGYRITLD